MLFRAMFWIGVVWLFLPHAGDSGAHAGGFSSSNNFPAASAAPEDFRSVLFDRLAAVRADIESAERIRAGR